MNNTECTNITADNREDKFRWKYFLRQIIVSSGVWASYMALGLCQGAPTVLIPQMRREANSTDAVTAEMASWISSASCFGALPWVCILSPITYSLGRKTPLIVVYVITLVGLVFMYFCITSSMILISEAIFGILCASMLTINIVIISEYCYPKYRGIFLCLKSASFMWGVWISNAVGTFFHWTNIPIIGVVLMVYALIAVTLSPESPYWLACRGRFEECTISHYWLKGHGEKSQQELKEMFSIFKDHIQKNNVHVSIISKLTASFRELISALKDATVYKPILICCALMFMYHSTGKIVCTVYAIDIIKKLTNHENTAYVGMLILDGITILGMYIGSGLSKILRRRQFLFTTAALSVMFTLVLSTYIYLINLELLFENKYVSVALLTGFSLSVSCGPMILMSTLLGEILPLKSRNTSACIVTLWANAIMGVYIKLSPYYFVTLKMHGTFLLFAVTTLILLSILYKYLPETKDKTLQEIQDDIKGRNKKVVMIDDASPCIAHE